MQMLFCQRWRLRLTIISGLAWALSATAADGVNLLTNSDFKRGESEWYLFVPASANLANCRKGLVAGGANGTGRMRLTSDEFARYALSSTQPVGVREGARYKISACVKGGDDLQIRDGTPGILIRLLCRDADGKDVRDGHLFLGLDGQAERSRSGPVRIVTSSLPKGWNRIEGIVEFPEGTRSVNIQLTSSETKGEIDWSDAMFEEVSPAEPLTPLLEAGVARTRLDEAEFLARLNVDAPGLEALHKALAEQDAAAARAAYLDYRRAATDAGWKSIFEGALPGPRAKDEILAEAMKIAANRIPIQGIIPPRFRNDPETIDFGSEIRWQWNPVPETEPEYTREFQYLINRMLFWESLAHAYALTGDERYPRAWVEQLTSWLAEDSAAGGGAGSLTWRSLEAAIRMNESWPYAYVSFLNSPGLTPEVHTQLAHSAMEHALYLADVLTGSPRRTGNWVANEALGLLITSLLFPEWKESDRFRTIAIGRLNREMEQQVNEDGSQKELSPWYHNVSLDCFRRALDVASFAKVDLGTNFKRKLHAMYRFNLSMMDQHGNVPMFNDGLPFNALPTLKVAADLFEDPLLRFAASGGKKGGERPTETAWLPDAGYAVFRSGWGPDDFTFWFDAGPPGIAHWHEDRLGVILSVAGDELLTEAGHCIYDSSPWRFYALGTTSHSTVTVDGKQQHAGGDSRPVRNRWVSTPLFDLCEGVYDAGYQRADYLSREYRPIEYVGKRDESVQHWRTVVFLKPSLFLVWDRLLGSGLHRYDAYFHLDGTATAIEPETKAVAVKGAHGGTVRIVPLSTNDLTARSAHGQTDPVLGWKTCPRRPLTTVIYTKEQAVPADFVNLVIPFKGEQGDFEVKEYSLREWGIRTAAGAFRLFLSPVDRQTIPIRSELWPDLEVEAALGVAQAVEPGKVIIAVDGATALQIKNKRYRLSSASSLVIHRIKMKRHLEYSIQNPTSSDIEITSEEDGKVHLIEPGYSWNPK